MSDYYGIDERVWREIVGEEKESPGLVALAASLCVEVLKEGVTMPAYRRMSPQERKAAMALGLNNKLWHPFAHLAELERSDIARECGASSLKIRNALAAWATAQERADLAIESLRKWDSKLGVWCACAIAETTFHLLSAQESRPRYAVWITREWVMGRAKPRQVREAAEDARLSISGDEDASFAAIRAADSVRNLESACSAVIHAVRSATKGLRIYGTTQWERGKYEEKLLADESKRLCEVVAAAIINYPTGDVIGDSGRVFAREGLASRVPWRVA